ERAAAVAVLPRRVHAVGAGYAAAVSAGAGRAHAYPDAELSAGSSAQVQLLAVRLALSWVSSATRAPTSMLLLPSHRLRRRRFHNGRWSVFTYGWLRRHCDQTRPPPDRRAGADRRRRALGVPGGRAAGARRAVATVAQSVPDHRRHFRGRGGGGRAGRRSASLAARGRGTGAGVGELPLEP